MREDEVREPGDVPRGLDEEEVEDEDEDEVEDEGELPSF